MPNASLRLRLVRPDDLLVLDIDLVNLEVSDDKTRLQKIEPQSPATITIHLPSQHVAERAFFEFEQTLEPVQPPPTSALAAAASRLVFTLPDDQGSLPFSVESLLQWSSLRPRLAPNALPPAVSDGPAPALPDADQTAIEFPYRLLISPDANARWVHRTDPFTVEGRSEVWHTRLTGEPRPAPVRAIARRPAPDAFRSSLSDRDLDEIVTLSSDFSIRPKSWMELRIPFGLWMARLRAAGLLNYDYVPLPLDAEQLILTPLGASARLRGRWTYPEPNQDPESLLFFGMPAPSLEQYEHIAGLGRDQYVRVVRRGFVHPGMRASIVKVTERRFEPRQLGTAQTPQGTVGIFGATAYLRQYYKIVIQQPEIDYAALAGGYEAGGREMPFRRLRLTTLETPKIDLPGGTAPERYEEIARERWILSHVGQPLDQQAELEIARNAQRLLESSFQVPFWITAGQVDVQFGFIATDWEEHNLTGSTPLLFVPYEKVTDTAAVVAVFAASPDTRRRRPLANQQLAIADPADSKPGSTAAPTESLTFGLQVVAPDRVASLPQDYRPRWVLAMTEASVRLESVARLTGNDTAVSITFDPAYLSGGLHPGANPAGVFAQMAPVAVAFGGSRGGGIARPDSAVDRLSSRQGALAAKFAQPSIGVGDLAAVFGGAKLFGTFDLKDILADIGAVGSAHYDMADKAEQEIDEVLADPTRHIEVPVLRTRPVISGGAIKAQEARFLWKPRLRSNDLLKFTDNQSELVLDARAVTPVGGGNATSRVRGELRRFELQFLGVVRVRMTLLRFETNPGRKPDVTAEGLDLQFDGPLQFVNSLRGIMPADGFSDPPAIEVTTEGISAGYSLGVPSVGVGIFSLQNLSLSAALSVPFVGKPAGLRFGISERHHPFLVSVTLFGGGGFFALGVSAAGVDEIEAAIEFGGNVSLNLGVASGGVYVMAGVYFGRLGSVATLTGYLRCGGYLSVLGLISITVEFYLAFTYRDKGNGSSEVWGQASVTVCVKVVCFSKSVSLSIERRFAGAGGDPTFDQVVEPADWQEYCRAFALDGVA